MRSRWVFSALLALRIAFAQEPPEPTRGPLTIEDIVKLSKQGVSDDVIIAALKGNAKPFNLNADEILELRKLGVSDAVVKYMEDPALPYSPPPPVPPPAPAPPPPPSNPAPVAPRPPSDPLALKVPPDAGIYYLTDKGDFVALDLKNVVPSKQPGKIPTLFKGHIVGSVVGAAAVTRLASRPATFYVRLGEKNSIDDLVLLRLDKSESRRNLDFGSKPGMPVFRVNSVKPFESKAVSPGLFRIVVPPNARGEYLFYVLGSADEKKSLLGRGYDFGVDIAEGTAKRQ